MTKPRVTVGDGVRGGCGCLLVPFVALFFFWVIKAALETINHP